MSYPIRHYDPNSVYFVTARCMQSRLLLRPSDLTNEIVGAALARAIRLTGVQVFAFVFTSNHFHLLVRADRPPQIAKFMQRLQSDIARKVGRLVSWTGRFFGRRYSAEPVVDDDAMVGRVQYILAHGVKEGHVSRSDEWPGLSCLAMVRDHTTPSFRWRDWSARWFQRRRTGQEVERFGNDCPTQLETLILTRLPAWEHLSPSEVTTRIRSMEAEIAASASPVVLGADRVRAQDPLSIPANTKTTPRPKCHASSLEGWQECVGALADFLRAYRTAALAWAEGQFKIEFPPNCFRPPPPFAPAG